VLAEALIDVEPDEELICGSIRQDKPPQDPTSAAVTALPIIQLAGGFTRLLAATSSTCLTTASG
jgi:hypothetical protein